MCPARGVQVRSFSALFQYKPLLWGGDGKGARNNKGITLNKNKNNKMHTLLMVYIGYIWNMSQQLSKKTLDVPDASSIRDH